VCVCVCVSVCVCTCVRVRVRACVYAGATKYSRDRYSPDKPPFNHKFHELLRPRTTGNCSFALEHNTDMLRSAACNEMATKEGNGETVELSVR